MPLDYEMSKSLASELLGYVRQNLPSVIYILSLHLISWGNFQFSLPAVMKAKSAEFCSTSHARVLQVTVFFDKLGQPGDENRVEVRSLRSFFNLTTEIFRLILRSEKHWASMVMKIVLRRDL